MSLLLPVCSIHCPTPNSSLYQSPAQGSRFLVLSSWYNFSVLSPKAWGDLFQVIQQTTLSGRYHQSVNVLSFPSQVYDSYIDSCRGNGDLQANQKGERLEYHVTSDSVRIPCHNKSLKVGIIQERFTAYSWDAIDKEDCDYSLTPLSFQVHVIYSECSHSAC